MSDAPPPVVLEEVLAELVSSLEAFQSAFAQRPGSGRDALVLWKRAREAAAECERFRELLASYEAVLVGLLWAHYPDEYRQKVYPLLQRIEEVGATALQAAPRRHGGILKEVQEIFLDRENHPASLAELVEELSRRGIQFRAREPVKSLGQAMRSSGRFEAVSRGVYRLKES